MVDGHLGFVKRVGEAGVQGVTHPPPVGDVAFFCFLQSKIHNNPLIMKFCFLIKVSADE
jgi:hypothetical protein